MRSQGRRQRLIVSAEPSFATAWLVPRLDRFRAVYVEVDVLIDSSLKIVDLERGEADVAIRFGAAPDNRLIARRLFDEQICALCSPALVSAGPRLHKLSDIRRATLLHWDMTELTWASTTRSWMEWPSWLSRMGVEGVAGQRGLVFRDYNLAVQAAVAGQGVILGSYPILRDLITAGLLVNPFEVMLQTNIGYDVVTTREALEKSAVKGFVDWITLEAMPLSRSRLLARRDPQKDTLGVLPPYT